MLAKKLEKLESFVKKKGRKLENHENTSAMYVSSARDISVQNEHDLERNLKRKEELLNEHDKKMPEVYSFIDKIKNYWKINSVDLAKTTMMFSPLFILAFLFWVAEGFATYYLGMEYLADRTIDNIIKACLWTIAVLAGTYVFKKMLPSLHRNTKYLIYTIFAVSMASFIYFIVQTGSMGDFIDSIKQTHNTEASIEKNITTPEEKYAIDKKEYTNQDILFRLSLLVLLLSGGLSISCIAREPRDEFEAKEILKVARPVLEIEDGIHRLNSHIDFNYHLKSQIDKNPLELETNSLDLYQQGLNSFLSRLFNSKERRERKEIEIVNRRKQNHELIEKEKLEARLKEEAEIKAREEAEMKAREEAKIVVKEDKKAQESEDNQNNILEVERFK